MVFGIRLSIGTIGEQTDNLAAAYQDCHGHCKLPHEQHAPLWASAAVTAVKVTLRIAHYFLDGRFAPTGAGAGNALGAGLRLVVVGGAGRPAGPAAR